MLGTSELPVVLISGNWQSAPLFDIFSKLSVLHGRVAFRQDLTEQPSEQPWILSPEMNANVVMAWEQVIDPAAVRGASSAGSVEVVRFPYIEARCFWPIAGTDPRNLAEDLYPNGRYPFSDKIVHAVSGLRGTDDEIYAEYLSPIGQFVSRI